MGCERAGRMVETISRSGAAPSGTRDGNERCLMAEGRRPVPPPSGLQPLVSLRTGTDIPQTSILPGGVTKNASCRSRRASSNC